MDEEAFNQSVRKFLKQVGVTSQQQIEKAVHEGIASGKLKGNERVPVTVRLESSLLGRPHVVEGVIRLG